MDGTTGAARPLAHMLPGVAVRLSPLRIALLYAVASAVFIGLSDALVAAIVPDVPTQAVVSIVKGWTFVLVTAVLLFLVVRAMARQIGSARNSASTEAARARRLIEVSRLAIVLLDEDGTIVDWNPQAERIFGWTAAEAIGQRSLWVPAEEMVDHRAVLAAIAAGELSEPVIRRRRRKDGSPVWIRIVASALRDPDGRLLFVGALEDVSRQIEAEREREAAAEQNRIMFERNPLPMFVVEPGTHRFLDVNESAATTFGWTREQLLGMTVEGLFPAGEPTDTLEQLAADSGPASITGARMRHATATGAILEVEVSARPVQLRGRLVWLAIVADVSEREAIERRRQVLLDRLEALHALDAEILQARTVDDVARRAASRARQLLPADRASVTVVDRETQTVAIIALDERRPLGHPAGWLCPIADAIPAGDPAHPRRVAIGDLQARVPEMDEPAVLRDARSRGIRTMLSIPLVAEGVLLGQLNLGSLAPDAFEPDAVAVAAELAESLAIALQQARYRQELVDNEARLRQVLAASPNATLLVDAAGLIRYANPTAEATLGEAPATLLGRRVDEFIPDAAQARHAALRSAHELAGGAAPAMQMDGTAHRSDGRELPASLSVSPLMTSDGPMVVATIIDLTERLALENQFRQAQKMEVMGQFANIMAHDFRNYLTVIGGFAELLSDDLAPDDPRKADVTEIQNVVGRASDLVRNILAFARPGLGPVGGDRTDVVAHLRDVRGMLARLGEPRVDLELAAEPDLPPVAINPAALTQILANLTTNARDAMRERGGTLRISVSTVETAGGDPDAPDFQVERRVRFEVADTGEGMDEETRTRIFEPFFTTKTAGEGDGRGSGLGLASVFSIVRRAHGRIEVHSEKGVGTTFLIDLPAAGPALLVR
jgi:two-component system, cell cycle sensor histidine kinase and response regulator CckA